MDPILKFYKKHDQILLPILFLLGAILIVFEVTMPSFSELTTLRADMQSREQKLKTYKNSYELLNSLNEATLNEEVTKARQALPPDKDPGAIYLAIVASATKAQSQLKALSLRLGDIYKKGDQGGEKLPQVVLTGIKLEGMNAQQFEVFVASLTKEFPLSTIASANINNEQGDIDLWFYYLPYNLSFINTENITPLTAEEQATLRSIQF